MCPQTFKENNANIENNDNINIEHNDNTTQGKEKQHQHNHNLPFLQQNANIERKTF
jgi:hypothetical protein